MSEQPVVVEVPSKEEGYKLIDQWLESVAFDVEPQEEFPPLKPEEDDEPEDADA